jgi:cytochrome c-type protein NapB
MIRPLAGALAATLTTTLVSIVLAAPAAAQETPAPTPIRGPAPIPELNRSDTYRMERHDRSIPREFDKQPPVIPHNIKGYQITRNVNMCMTCHAKKAAQSSGATAVSKSHYFDRDENVLPNISARRYFCLQCHVPQFDADPLVANTFKPATR